MVLLPEERQYKKTVNRIAYTMLIFWGAFAIVSGLVAVLMIGTSFLPATAGTVTYQIVYGFLYTAIFVLPVCFFALIVPKAERAPILMDWHLPRETPLYSSLD